MRVFKVKLFARYQRKEGIDDAVLRKALREAESGLIEADLGHGLIKQRLARPGSGKRGSYRTIIAYRRHNRAVFLFGFAKNAKSDLTSDEARILARVGAAWLIADDELIETALVNGKLKELHLDTDNEG